MKKVILLCCLCLMLAGLDKVNAEVPHTINYQGYYTDDNENPISDTRAVVFRLYTAISGGTLVWEENQTVTFNEGYFNVQLGMNTSLANVDFSRTYFLSVQVGAILMTPRQQLNSVPYALYAKYAEQVSVPQVHSGEKNVTSYSDGQIYINLIKTPKDVKIVLHLRKFEEAYYRELPSHQHVVTGNGTTGNQNASHSHQLLVAQEYGPGGSGWAIVPEERPSHMQSGWISENIVSHQHGFSFSTTSEVTGSNLTSPLQGIQSVKTYCNDLRVHLNSVDITSTILSKSGLSKLGDGAGEANVTVSIGDLGEWQVGENGIRLSLASGGGKVIYEIYVWY